MIVMHQQRFSSISVLVALITLFVVGGCDSSDTNGYTSNGDDPSPSPGELVRSEKERETSPVVPEGDPAELAAGNSAFAFDLYQQLRDEVGNEDGNIFYSPHSISLALAMTYAGAQNETERQMADTLHFTLPQERLHPTFNALDLELASRGEGAAGADGEGFRLNIVNTIWGQIGYSFRPEFLDVLAENYGAGLRLLDFSTAPEESRVTINDWVSDETEGRIEDLIPQGGLTPLTRLVLTNAIYFNAAWSEPFDESRTRDEPFNLLDGSQVAVPMMRHVAIFGYTAGEGHQTVELPYDGGELSMVVILPAAGQFEELDGTIDAAYVETILNDLHGQEIDLIMPRFTFEWDTSLKGVLSAMGMPIAFDAFNADFLGITSIEGLQSGDEPLYIGDVIHKAFVAVDEAGTEAAAATAVVMEGATSAEPPPEPLIVRIDRPFVFLIRDLETGAILFVGRVVDPSAS